LLRYIVDGLEEGPSDDADDDDGGDGEAEPGSLMFDSEMGGGSFEEAASL
jgi:hypothetical protein